jgi:hypothetical protein
MQVFSIENETNNITIHASAAEAEAILDAERFASEEELSSLAANWPASRLVEVWNSLTGVTPVRKFKDRATAVTRIWKAIQTLGEALPQEADQQPAAEPVIEHEAEAAAVPVEAPTEPEAATPEAEPVPSSEADVPAPVTPQTAHVATEEAPATNEATPATGRPTASPDEKLLRLLARSFEGLSSEQVEAKWDALKSALATRKTAAAAPRKAARTEASREGSKTSQVIAMLNREGGVTLEEIMSTMGWQKHTTRAMLSAGGSLVKKHGLVIISEKQGDKRVYSIKA